MFNKLKKRWRVNGLDLVLIICTFALGGSLCGYLGRKLMAFTNLEKGVVWVLLYVIVITLIWPVCVILLSIPFGQFTFFKNYLAKIWKKIGGSRSHQQQIIAIFASGAGSNAQKIIDHFRNSASVKIGLIVCNKPTAGVIQLAEQETIPALIIDKETFFSGSAYLPELKRNGIDFIVLAGFLWKMPLSLIDAYAGKIINIHPALLPNYGGKGMYGSRVHEAVIANRETESGISIHYVDELYDHGKLIFQAKCKVAASDTADTLAAKVHTLEHEHYPRVISQLLEIPK